MSSVVHIFIASAKAAPVASVTSVEALAGEGLRGDRYAAAKNRRGPDYQVSLIELENIEAFTAQTGLGLSPGQPRRNIVTRGVRLNDLCGKRFRIGAAVFEGLELCEPCSVFAKNTHREALKWFVGRGGLRARIVHGGEVRVGDAVEGAGHMQLVRPGPEHLPRYVAALERGWSPDNTRPEAARDELSRIQADANAFLDSLEDREAKGAPVTLPDGSKVKRLPGFRRWAWDGDFCGSISLRWQPGTTELPAHCLGHIGYGVVPWKQRLGYATSALRLLLPEAKAVGLPFVELTTDPDNIASQRTIEANGGVLVERFTKPAQFGGKPGLRYRIDLIGAV